MTPASGALTVSRAWRRGMVRRFLDARDTPSWQQIALQLALAVGFAFLVNWGVLTLLGQKSAARAEHSLVGILLLMAYVALVVRRQAGYRQALGVFFLMLMPCYVGTVFPDLDITFFGIGGHRNPLFHSSLSFLILLACVRRQHRFLQLLVAGYGVGLASHLWWDVLYYGDVRWLPGGTSDRLWLGAHGLLCLIPGRRLLGLNRSVR